MQERELCGFPRAVYPFDHEKLSGKTMLAIPFHAEQLGWGCAFRLKLYYTTGAGTNEAGGW
jgi:hypothetical protein